MPRLRLNDAVDTVATVQRDPIHWCALLSIPERGYYMRARDPPRRSDASRCAKVRDEAQKGAIAMVEDASSAVVCIKQREIARAGFISFRANNARPRRAIKQAPEPPNGADLMQYAREGPQSILSSQLS